MNYVEEAEVLLVLLTRGAINAGERQAIFCLYYRVRERDKNLADAILRDTTSFMGIYARQRRRLKQLDKEIEEELVWKARSVS